MKYKVNEIFYSIQGEGFNTGRSAVFVRLSGCNLACPWCDTKDHNQGKWYSKEELEKEVRELADSRSIVVFTGGEPTLQLKEEEPLLEEYFKTIETNGTNKIPSWIDWVTCSPKTDIDFTKSEINPDEVKVIYESEREEYFKSLIGQNFELFLQPLELNGKMNIKETIDFIKKYPEYRLSLQTHKMVGIR